MNLLITGAWQQSAEHIPAIEAMGHAVTFLQQERDALPCDPSWPEGIIANGIFLHHPIEQFRNLRYVQITSAGTDRVPTDYMRAHGITLHNARGVYSVPMAEFVLAGVLDLYKRMGDFRDQQRRHEWRKLRNLRELANKRVLIVGCGSVGTACAQRFRAFDTTVVGVDLAPREDEHYHAMHGLEHLDAELAQADVVVVTVPLTKQTHRLVKARALKPGAILVNVSRGGTVDLDGVNAAVLDVFDQEPLSDNSPLWNNKNIVLTPHNSFVGEGNGARLCAVILKNLEASL